jgi:hypothetical protein
MWADGPDPCSSTETSAATVHAAPAAPPENREAPAQNRVKHKIKDCKRKNVIYKIQIKC